jgi:hypothetical protein
MLPIACSMGKDEAEVTSFFRLPMNQRPQTLFLRVVLIISCR